MGFSEKRHHTSNLGKGTLVYKFLFPNSPIEGLLADFALERISNRYILRTREFAART